MIEELFVKGAGAVLQIIGGSTVLFRIGKTLTGTKIDSKFYRGLLKLAERVSLNSSGDTIRIDISSSDKKE